jgi:tripartite-type tricarboxylate transporter receptor subunit TctC
VNKLSMAAAQAAKSADLAGRISALGGEAVGSPPDVFGSLIAKEIPRWQVLIQDLGMTGTLQ